MRLSVGLCVCVHVRVPVCAYVRVYLGVCLRTAESSKGNSGSCLPNRPAAATSLHLVPCADLTPCQFAFSGRSRQQPRLHIRFIF